MRTQVDYDFRLLRVSATDPTAGRSELTRIVKEYLQLGWELIRAETVTYAGNEAFIAYHFVRYEKEESKAKSK